MSVSATCFGKCLPPSERRYYKGIYTSTRLTSKTLREKIK